jgi:predicted N-acyltransferase
MPLLWNAIKTKAATFVPEWGNDQSVWEKVKTQTFDTEFLKILEVDQRKAILLNRRLVSNAEIEGKRRENGRKV